MATTTEIKDMKKLDPKFVYSEIKNNIGKNFNEGEFYIKCKKVNRKVGEYTVVENFVESFVFSFTSQGISTFTPLKRNNLKQYEAECNGDLQFPGRIELKSETNDNNGGKPKHPPRKSHRSGEKITKN